MGHVANGVKLPEATFIDLTENKGNRVQMSLRLDPELHEKVLTRMAPLRLKFQTLVESLMERWVTGELDRRGERPISSVESDEDAEILRVIHRPADRAEVLVAETVKHYLRLKRGQK